ncbi:MAG: histidine triad nucleotide-binding protein [Bdellovibrionota bacterium]
MLKDDCLFCKIIKGQIPAAKIFENEKVFAFKDIHPQAEQHYLVIPKFHVESLAHLEDSNTSIVNDLFRAANQISETEGFKSKGYRSVINTGKNGGQTVFHLHLHVMSDEKMSAKFGSNT